MSNHNNLNHQSLNEMAVKTFTELLALSDKEFFEFFDKIKPSDLSSILAETDLVKNHKDK